MKGSAATRCAFGSVQQSGLLLVSCFIIYFNFKVLYCLLLFYFMHTPLKKTFDNPDYLARSRKYDHKCACDICACGKHRCPDPAPKFQAQTTNHYYYKPYQVKPQQKQKPRDTHIQTHYDPNLIQSSYKTTFTPHKVQKPVTSPQKDKYEPSKTPFQGESEYKTRYLANRGKVERFNTSPSKEYAPNPARFEDTTTYKREFSPKKVDNTPKTFRKTNNYQPSPTPFEAKTSYEISFKPYKIQPKSPDSTHLNRTKYTPNPERFQGNSRYRQFYQPYKIEPKERCPNEWLPSMPSRCSPEKTHLYFSAEKNSWE